MLGEKIATSLKNACESDRTQHDVGGLWDFDEGCIGSRCGAFGLDSDPGVTVADVTSRREQIEDRMPPLSKTRLLSLVYYRYLVFCILYPLGFVCFGQFRFSSQRIYWQIVVVIRRLVRRVHP